MSELNTFQYENEVPKVPETKNIEDINTERELIDILVNNGSVIAYVGTDQDIEAGTMLNKPFGGSSPEERQRFINEIKHEKCIEDLRKIKFPNTPSRSMSVFIAPSIIEAKNWGKKTYRVLLKIKDTTQGNQEKNTREIIAWLSRRPFERLADISFLGSIDEMKRQASLYLNSQGGHTDSEILVNPNKVEVQVLGEYVPSEEEAIKIYIKKLFTDDSLQKHPPENFEDLKDRVEYEITNIPELINKEELVLKEAVKELIRIKAKKYHPGHSYRAFDFNIVNGKINQWEIDEIFGVLKDNNPFENEQELTEIRNRLENTLEYATKNYHQFVLSYLQELSQESWSKKEFPKWEITYREACRIAGVEPQETLLDILRGR